MAQGDDPNQPERSAPTRWRVSKLAFASRVLLGLLLISGGINNFLARNPVANPTPEADRFLEFLLETGYLLQTVAITEITVGVLLLSGRFIPLALALFAPVMVNIMLFHAFLQLAGIGTALFAGALYAHLVVLHRGRFAGVLSP